jgi:hypothetical protein
MTMRLKPGFIVMHCAGFLAALLAGIVLAGHDWGVHVGAVLSAGLGAMIAVFGAAWISEHREEGQRQQLLAILITALGDLGGATTPAIAALDRGGTVPAAVRPVVAQWETISAFEPYRELGNFQLVRLLLKVGAECRALYPLMGEEPPPALQGSASKGYSFDANRRVDPTPAREQLEKIANACQEALAPIHAATTLGVKLPRK